MYWVFGEGHIVIPPSCYIRDFASFVHANLTIYIDGRSVGDGGLPAQPGGAEETFTVDVKAPFFDANEGQEHTVTATLDTACNVGGTATLTSVSLYIVAV